MCLISSQIEKLEEERIELKSQMRKIAQMSGQRAVALGLTADDMVEVNSFIENLKAKKDGLGITHDIKAQAEQETLRLKVILATSDLLSCAYHNTILDSGAECTVGQRGHEE